VSRPQPAAVNAAPAIVTDYAPDPRGWSMFAGLVAAQTATLNGPVPAVPSAATWFGWSRPKQTQQMTGAAAAVAQGRARAIAPRNSELSRETTTTDSTTAAIFASRMTRGQ
jgi:hypothetical protein